MDVPKPPSQKDKEPIPNRYLKKLDIKLVDGEFENPIQEQLKDPSQLYEVFKKLKDKNQETALAVYLEDNLEVRAYDVISVGGEDVTLLIPREVFGRAFMIKSYTFIIIHNHPSGDPTPTNADKRMMAELIRGSKELNLNFLDFIIVGENSYWSMFEAVDGGDYEIGAFL